LLYEIVLLEQCLGIITTSVARRNCLIFQKRGASKRNRFFHFIGERFEDNIALEQYRTNSKQIIVKILIFKKRGANFTHIE